MQKWNVIFVTGFVRRCEDATEQEGHPTLYLSLDITPQMQDGRDGHAPHGQDLFVSVTLRGKVAAEWAELLREGDYCSIKGKLVRIAHVTKEGERRNLLTIKGEHVLGYTPVDED